MAKINTTVPVLYDSRDNKTAVVIVEMTVVENGKDFNITITDFSDKDGVITFIRSKPYFQTEQEINALYEAVDHLIDKSLPYIEQKIQRQEFALLHFVQNCFIKDENGEVIEGKTIYNLLPEQWVIRKE